MVLDIKILNLYMVVVVLPSYFCVNCYGCGLCVLFCAQIGRLSLSHVGWFLSHSLMFILVLHVLLSLYPGLLNPFGSPSAILGWFLGCGLCILVVVGRSCIGRSLCCGR